MIVFVHGVPETAALWDRVREAVGGESVAVGLPGFGTPRPDGFGGTKDDHADWLVARLDALGARERPVDLVGHDWGAGLTYRVATAAGDRLRSWVADVGNIVHPDYVWHDFARIWQTPGEGESLMAAMTDGPAEERGAAYVGMGIPEAEAVEMAAAFDARMGEAILSLYRSAAPNPHADWGPWAPTKAPGLVIHPTEDPFSDEAQASEVAAALGARVAVLDGVGHFWPYQAPEQAAAILTDFWSSL